MKQQQKNLRVIPVSPTNQDLSNDTTYSQIKSDVPVPLNQCSALIVAFLI